MTTKSQTPAAIAARAYKAKVESGEIKVTQEQVEKWLVAIGGVGNLAYQAMYQKVHAELNKRFNF